MNKAIALVDFIGDPIYSVDNPFAACAAKLVSSGVLRAENEWEAALELKTEPGSPALFGVFECPGGDPGKLKVGVSEMPKDENDDAGYFLIFEAGRAAVGRRSPGAPLGLELAPLKAEKADSLANSLNVAGAVNILNRQLDKRLASADAGVSGKEAIQVSSTSESGAAANALSKKFPKA